MKNEKIDDMKDLDSLLNKLKSLEIELVDVTLLIPHEDINENNFVEIKNSIFNEGVIKLPIVVDKSTNIIIDGHHRLKVFKELKIKVIPVFYTNYSDEKIILRSWFWSGTMLTKNDILQAAKTGKIFPSKTTKHMYKSRDGLVHISSIVSEIRLDIVKLKSIGGRLK